jgi:hypothetical protein
MSEPSTTAQRVDVARDHLSRAQHNLSVGDLNLAPSATAEALAGILTLAIASFDARPARRNALPPAHRGR